MNSLWSAKAVFRSCWLFQQHSLTFWGCESKTVCSSSSADVAIWRCVRAPLQCNSSNQWPWPCFLIAALAGAVQVEHHQPLVSRSSFLYTLLSFTSIFPFSFLQKSRFLSYCTLKEGKQVLQIIGSFTFTATKKRNFRLAAQVENMKEVKKDHLQTFSAYLWLLFRQYMISAS